MSALKLKNISPLSLSLFHFLPSLLLIALVCIGLFSLSFSRDDRVVLGAQSSLPQVRTMTVEDRIKELKQATTKYGSSSIEKQATELIK